MSVRPVFPVRSLAAVLAGSALTVAALAGPATSAQAAVATHTSPSVTTGTGRVPGAFRAAVTAAARSSVSHDTATPGLTARATANGVRPIGSGVSTNLPTRIELGSPVLQTNYTVEVPTAGLDNPAIEIALADGQGNLIVDTYVNGQAHQSSYTGFLAVPLQAVTRTGAAHWLIAYGPSDGDYGTVKAATLGTTIKFQSLLAERVTRSGTRLHITGTAKAYSPESYTFLPRTGQPVALQRWASTGWVTIAVLRTDSHGNLQSTVRIPWRVGLRLTDRDNAETFGATTPSTVA